MKNQEIAQIFYNIADILEMKGVEWKPRAYRKAARALANQLFLMRSDWPW